MDVTENQFICFLNLKSPDTIAFDGEWCPHCPFQKIGVRYPHKGEAWSWYICDPSRPYEKEFENRWIKRFLSHRFDMKETLSRKIFR